MSDKAEKRQHFWQELKRRKVVRVVSVYAAAAFVILELVDIITEPFGLPEWTMKLVVVLMSIGLIVSVIISWIYDINPEGRFEKTQAAHKAAEKENPPASNRWKIASFISVLVILALIVLNIIPRSDRSTEESTLEKSIAVLPFRNDSPDIENEYFINGTMESILDKLCKIEDLKVIARTSVEQYRDKPAHIAEIAEALDVSYILEGSGQKYGAQIRLTVQLIDATRGDHIWSKQYDKELKDVFSIQSEIAQLIANEIKATVTPEVKERIEKIPTGNMEAYQLYLQGRHYLAFGRGKEGIDSSIYFLKKALEIDPEYALAYSGLAAAYSAYAHAQMKTRSEVMHLARDAAEKALDIDNTLGEAHAELAWTRIYQDFNWKEGEKGLLLALELNPNYARAHRNYSWLLTFLGRHEEAIAEAHYAVELNPLSNSFLAWIPRVYLYARDYDRALEAALQFTEVNPGNYAYEWLALTYLAKGMKAEALEVMKKVTRIHGMVAYIYGMSGDQDKAWEILDMLTENPEENLMYPTEFTMAHLGLGEKKIAMDYLEEAYEQREGWLVLIQVELMYDSLRADPRFQAMIEKMNFPNYDLK